MVDVTTYCFQKIVTLAKNLVICVAQKNCSTKQIAVQSHGSCFIYLGFQLTHKDC